MKIKWASVITVAVLLACAVFLFQIRGLAQSAPPCFAAGNCPPIPWWATGVYAAGYAFFYLVVALAQAIGM